jgi:hypothetical protein
VSIYDTASRTRLGDPIPWSAGASLRPDGAAVAVGTGDGVAIWDLNPQHLAAAACRLAGRNLTRAEWDTYLAALGQYRRTCPRIHLSAPPRTPAVPRGSLTKPTRSLLPGPFHSSGLLTS